MGTDKARLCWPGEQPMAVEVALALRTHCQRVRLVRHSPADESWCWPDLAPIGVVHDRPGQGRHPLWGLVAALSSATTEVVLVAPCDLPLLTPEAVARLVEPQRAVVAAGAGRVHPLLGVFEVSELRRAERAARDGMRVMDFVRDYRCVELPDDVLRNVNEVP